MEQYVSRAYAPIGVILMAALVIIYFAAMGTRKKLGLYLAQLVIVTGAAVLVFLPTAGVVFWTVELLAVYVYVLSFQ